MQAAFGRMQAVALRRRSEASGEGPWRRRLLSEGQARAARLLLGLDLAAPVRHHPARAGVDAGGVLAAGQLGAHLDAVDADGDGPLHDARRRRGAGALLHGASRALRERHHAVPRVLVHEVRASLVHGERDRRLLVRADLALAADVADQGGPAVRRSRRLGHISAAADALVQAAVLPLDLGPLLVGGAVEHGARPGRADRGRLRSSCVLRVAARGGVLGAAAALPLAAPLRLLLAPLARGLAVVEVHGSLHLQRHAADALLVAAAIPVIGGPVGRLCDLHAADVDRPRLRVALPGDNHVIDAADGVARHGHDAALATLRDRRDGRPLAGHGHLELQAAHGRLREAVLRDAVPLHHVGVSGPLAVHRDHRARGAGGHGARGAVVDRPDGLHAVRDQGRLDHVPGEHLRVGKLRELREVHHVAVFARGQDLHHVAVGAFRDAVVDVPGGEQEVVDLQLRWAGREGAARRGRLDPHEGLDLVARLEHLHDLAPADLRALEAGLAEPVDDQGVAVPAARGDRGHELAPGAWGQVAGGHEANGVAGLHLVARSQRLHVARHGRLDGLERDRGGRRSPEERLIHHEAPADAEDHQRDGCAHEREPAIVRPSGLRQGQLVELALPLAHMLV
mmetsp:Transcript_14254/g.42498  ORF Transcript_14254/g.42498 Transcript_14254/m.42498 type:complete len:624 (+) Transcript_14254:69-1940(+)